MSEKLKEKLIEEYLSVFRNCKSEPNFKNEKLKNFFKEGTYSFKNKSMFFNFCLQRMSLVDLSLIISLFMISLSTFDHLNLIIYIILNILTIIVSTSFLIYDHVKTLKKYDIYNDKDDFSERVEENIKEMFKNKKSPLVLHIPASLEVLNIIKSELNEHEVKHLMKLGKNNDIYLKDIVNFLMNSEDEDLDLKYKKMMNKI